MRSSDAHYCALSISVAAAMLAGCSGSTSPVGAPTAMSQSGTRTTYLGDGKSWMRPEAKHRDLLYVSKPFYPGARDVYVYTFPGAKPIGMLGGFGEPRGECADKSGNVFIIDSSDSYLYEYAHAGTNPISVVQSNEVSAAGCSVDPVSGKLAVSGGGSGKVVSIFVYKPGRGWTFPKTYSVSGMNSGTSCSFDDKGNLYLDGTSASRTFILAELPHNSKTFLTVTLNKNIGAAGEIQWDGKHLAIGEAGTEPLTIDEFAMSGTTGKKIGSTTLDGSKDVADFWIQGKWVVGPDSSYSGAGVGFWPYPAGGNSSTAIDLYEPYGAVVSVAK